MTNWFKNFFREFKGGIIAGAVIVGAVWGVIFFSFYDIYVFSRVHIKEAQIWASHLREDADLKARALYFDSGMRAGEKLLDAQTKAAHLVTQARGSGFKIYYAAILQNLRDDAVAKKIYAIDMKQARLEAAFYRNKAKNESDKVLQQAYEEYSVINLFLASRNTRKVTGYYYDPRLGRLAPRLEGDTAGEDDVKK